MKLFTAFTHGGHCTAQPEAKPVVAGQAKHTPLVVLVAVFRAVTAFAQLMEVAAGRGGGLGGGGLGLGGGGLGLGGGGGLGLGGGGGSGGNGLGGVGGGAGLGDGGGGGLGGGER